MMKMSSISSRMATEFVNARYSESETRDDGNKKESVAITSSNKEFGMNNRIAVENDDDYNDNSTSSSSSSSDDKTHDDLDYDDLYGSKSFANYILPVPPHFSSDNDDGELTNYDDISGYDESSSHYMSSFCLSRINEVGLGEDDDDEEEVKIQELNLGHPTNNKKCQDIKLFADDCSRSIPLKENIESLDKQLVMPKRQQMIEEDIQCNSIPFVEQGLACPDKPLSRPTRQPTIDNFSCIGSTSDEEEGIDSIPDKPPETRSTRQYNVEGVSCLGASIKEERIEPLPEKSSLKMSRMQAIEQSCGLLLEEVPPSFPDKSPMRPTRQQTMEFSDDGKETIPTATIENNNNNNVPPPLVISDTSPAVRDSRGTTLKKRRSIQDKTFLVPSRRGTMENLNSSILFDKSMIIQEDEPSFIMDGGRERYISLYNNMSNEMSCLTLPPMNTWSSNQSIVENPGDEVENLQQTKSSSEAVPVGQDKMPSRPTRRGTLEVTSREEYLSLYKDMTNQVSYLTIPTIIVSDCDHPVDECNDSHNELKDNNCSSPNDVRLQSDSDNKQGHEKEPRRTNRRGTLEFISRAQYISFYKDMPMHVSCLTLPTMILCESEYPVEESNESNDEFGGGKSTSPNQVQVQSDSDSKQVQDNIPRRPCRRGTLEVISRAEYLSHYKDLPNQVSCLNIPTVILCESEYPVEESNKSRDNNSMSANQVQVQSDPETKQGLDKGPRRPSRRGTLDVISRAEYLSRCQDMPHQVSCLNIPTVLLCESEYPVEESNESRDNNSKSSNQVQLQSDPETMQGKDKGPRRPSRRGTLEIISRAEYLSLCQDMPHQVSFMGIPTMSLSETDCIVNQSNERRDEDSNCTSPNQVQLQTDSDSKQSQDKRPFLPRRRGTLQFINREECFAVYDDMPSQQISCLTMPSRVLFQSDYLLDNLNELHDKLEVNNSLPQNKEADSDKEQGGDKSPCLPRRRSTLRFINSEQDLALYDDMPNQVSCRTMPTMILFQSDYRVRQLNEPLDKSEGNKSTPNQLPLQANSDKNQGEDERKNTTNQVSCLTIPDVVLSESAPPADQSNAIAGEIGG